MEGARDLSRDSTREASRPPVRDPPEAVAAPPSLRRALGNHTYRTLLEGHNASKSPVQSKNPVESPNPDGPDFEMEAPGSSAEQEAQQLAAQSGSSFAPPSPPDGMPPSDRAGRALNRPDAGLVARALNGGTRLPPSLRGQLEHQFARDLGGVRLHHGPTADAAARRLDTRAFTVGQDIVLAARAPEPGTSVGLRLMVHEVVHVLQGPPGATRAGPARIRREDPEDTVSDGTVLAPTVDEEPAPGLDIRRATRLNQVWWILLQLGNVYPLGTITPIDTPTAYANRVREIQRASRAPHLRALTEGRALSVDGILGPRTLWFLFSLARQVSIAGDRQPFLDLGADLEALADALVAAAAAYAIMHRPLIAARWTFRQPAARLLRYYRQQYELNRNDADLLDAVLFSGPAPPDVTRDDRHELLSLIYGGQDLPGVGALVSVDRNYLHSFDNGYVVSHGARGAGQWSTFFAFRISTTDAADEAVAELGIRLPGGHRARQVRERLGEAGPPLSGLLLSVDIPEPDPAHREAVVAQYLARKRIAGEQAREEAEANNRMAARQRADRFLDLAGERRDLEFTVNLQKLMRDFIGKPAFFFEYFLDDLSGREPSQFDNFFDAVEGTRSFAVHAPVMRLALGTTYASGARVRESLEILNSRRQGVLRSHYQADGVRLGGSAGPLLRVGEVAGDRSGIYLKDQSLDRITPNRMAELAEVAQEKAKDIFGAILGGRDSRSLTQEEIAEQAFEEAAKQIHLNEEDVERDVEYEESVRLLSIQQVTEDGIERSWLTWQVVERWGGEGGWSPVSGGEESGDDMAFDFRLSLYRLSQITDVVEGFAVGLVVVGAVALAWEAGLVALLLRAAGGAAMVSTSIGISVVIYVATSYWRDEPLTLKGFLFAALDGYLGALAFHRFAPLGRIISARFAVGPTVTMRRLVAGWLLSRAVTGAAAGAATGPASLFARELVEVLSGDRSRFSSLEAYLTQVGYGALLGAAFEIGGGALFATLRGQGGTALAQAADVAKALQARGISPRTWLAQGTGVLSRFWIWARANLHDDIASAVVKEAREQLAAVTTALAGAGRTGFTRLRGDVLRQVLELADVELTRDATEGLERMLTTGQAGGHALTNDAAIDVLQRLRAHPERTEPFLALMKDIQTPVLDDLLARTALPGLADAPGLLSISGRLTPASTGTLLRDHFAMSVSNFEDFAQNLLRIDQLRAPNGWPGMFDGHLLQRLLDRVTPRVLVHIYDNSADVAASAAFVDTIAPGAVVELNHLAPQQMRELFTRDPRIIQAIAAGAEDVQIRVLQYIRRLDEVFQPATPGVAQRAGHAATGHGPHIPDEAMFARAALEGHDISRWTSVTTLTDALEEARLAMIDDAHALATRSTDACPINARGWAQVDAGTRTVTEILTNPAHRRFLKGRVEYTGHQAGAGQSFDPDGATIRPADNFIVVLALDDAANYRVITGFPQR